MRTNGRIKPPCITSMTGTLCMCAFFVTICFCFALFTIRHFCQLLPGFGSAKKSRICDKKIKQNIKCLGINTNKAPEKSHTRKKSNTRKYFFFALFRKCRALEKEEEEAMEL